MESDGVRWSQIESNRVRYSEANSIRPVIQGQNEVQALRNALLCAYRRGVPSWWHVWRLNDVSSRIAFCISTC